MKDFRPDEAGKRTAELREIRRVFQKADEVYRELRVRLFEDPPDGRYMPLEWIPISAH